MIIVKEFYNIDLFFDNTLGNTSTMTIVLEGENLMINFDSIINSLFTNESKDLDYEYLKSYFNLGGYSKAPCGGFINFFNVTGSKGNKYILYSGVNEVSNSHFIVTIHKILKS